MANWLKRWFDLLFICNWIYCHEGIRLLRSNCTNPSNQQIQSILHYFFLNFLLQIRFICSLSSTCYLKTLFQSILQIKKNRQNFLFCSSGYCNRTVVIWYKFINFKSIFLSALFKIRSPSKIDFEMFSKKIIIH